MMQKLMINQALDNMGLATARRCSRPSSTASPGTRPKGCGSSSYAERHGFRAAVEWRDSGRPLPDVPPGDAGEAFMTPPPKVKGGARSRWSSDVAGRRAKPAAKKATKPT